VGEALDREPRRGSRTNITPEQVEAVRMFVWKAAIEAGDTARSASLR
jgi:hypothetical protein